MITNSKYIETVVRAGVAQLGVPVLGQVLTAEGVTSRSELRKLVHQGVLRDCDIIIDNKGKAQVVKGYYTLDLIPECIKAGSGDLDARVSEYNQKRRIMEQVQTYEGARSPLHSPT